MTTSSEKGTTPSENGTFASKNWKVVGTKEGVRADGSSSLTLCIHRVRESEAKKRKKMELEAEQSQKKKRKRGKFLALAKGMETRMFLEPPASLLARAATQCLPNCAVARGQIDPAQLRNPAHRSTRSVRQRHHVPDSGRWRERPRRRDSLSLSQKKHNAQTPKASVDTPFIRMLA